MEKKTILIVDDEKYIRWLCQEELNKEGYDVILAEDGREAIREVEESNPDLVILDIKMPRMDGIEALPKILRKKGNLPVILYTGYSHYGDNLMKQMADAYVMKSSDLTELKGKIKQLLGEE
jgi:CheY-like chemotaxis protein